MVPVVPTAATRAQADLEILLDGSPQQVHAQGVVVIRGDQAQEAAAEARQQRGLLDGAVPLVRGVDHQGRLAALQALAALGVARGALPGAEQGREGGGAGGVVDDAGEGRAEAHHLPQPVHDDLLDLRGRGTGLPAHALGAQARRGKVPEDRAVAGVAGEVGEEGRVVPVGDARQDVPVQGRQHLIHAPALLRRVVREGRPDVAGLGLAHDGQALEALAVVRDPVHELITEAAEVVLVHGDHCG